MEVPCTRSQQGPLGTLRPQNMPNLEPAESNAKLTRTRNYITNLIGSTSQFGTEEYTLPYVYTSTCINPIKLQLLNTCNANLPCWFLKNFTTKCNLIQLSTIEISNPAQHLNHPNVKIATHQKSAKYNSNTSLCSSSTEDSHPAAASVLAKSSFVAITTSTFY